MKNSLKCEHRSLSQYVFICILFYENIVRMKSVKISIFCVLKMFGISETLKINDDNFYVAVLIIVMINSNTILLINYIKKIRKYDQPISFWFFNEI